MIYVHFINKQIQSGVIGNLPLHKGYSHIRKRIRWRGDRFSEEAKDAERTQVYRNRKQNSLI